MPNILQPKVGELTHIIIDCNDIERVSRFWSAALGLELAAPTPPYQDLISSDQDKPVISFQQVPELKAGKNRLHMDIKVEDLDIAEARIKELGGTILDRMNYKRYIWSIAADPEGNEFCLITTVG